MNRDLADVALDVLSDEDVAASPPCYRENVRWDFPSQLQWRKPDSTGYPEPLTHEELHRKFDYLLENPFSTYTADEASFLLSAAAGTPYGAALLSTYDSTDPGGVRAVHRRRPGDEVTVRMSAKSMFLFSDARQAAAIALLNGQPIAGPWWYRYAPNKEFPIVWRDELTFTLPEEPGRYDFNVMYFEDALIPITEPPDGRPHVHYDTKSRFHGGYRSNTLMFSVE